jgi:hypothetical protein
MRDGDQMGHLDVGDQLGLVISQGTGYKIL